MFSTYNIFFRYILLFIVFLFLMSGILMWLWNITITKIFNIGEITYWDTFKILVIVAILFVKIFTSILIYGNHNL